MIKQKFIGKKTGRLVTRFVPTMAEVEAANENYGGFCIGCGREAEGVEPDARRYTCESCGECRVYGAEELAIMGLVA
jgi:hypothetical protein